MTWGDWTRVQRCCYGRWGIGLESFGREVEEKGVGWDIGLVWSRVSSKEQERASTLFDPWRGRIPTLTRLPGFLLRSDPRLLSNMSSVLLSFLINAEDTVVLNSFL